MSDSKLKLVHDTGSRGGSRKGAGRKSVLGEAMVVKRVPASLIPTIDTLIENLKLQQFPDSWDESSASELSIPLALERIPAGFPSPAESYVADYLDFNTYLVQNPTATIAVRSGGDSMIDIGIAKDDILIIDRSVTAKHMDIVMADIGNEYTIKRLCILPDGSVELRPENRSGIYTPIKFKDQEQLRIVGVIMHVIKDFRS